MSGGGADIGISPEELRELEVDKNKQTNKGDGNQSKIPAHCAKCGLKDCPKMPKQL